MTTKIIIVGTCHTLQCGDAARYSTNQIDNYRSFIRDKSLHHKVKIVAEEMSDEGLEYHGTSATIAEKLVKTLNDIEHHYIDIPSAIKRQLKIDNDSLAIFSEFRFSKQNKGNDKLEKLSKIISNPARECCWFAQILDINIWPAMFVCGENHVENMSKLIQKADKNAFVCAYHLQDYLGEP